MLVNEVFERSFKIAQEVANMSERLVNEYFEVEDHYIYRTGEWTDILGVEGYTSFTPFIEPQLHLTLRHYLRKEVERKYEKARDLINRGCDDEIVYKVRRERELLNTLIDSLSTELILSNKIPDEFREHVDYFNLKGYSSPKLSKALVRLLGEQSDTVKWFTNECPKTLTAGFNEHYRIYLSALPHHIVGMSYFAPYNHGGERWLEGWEGTSCLDPTRNGNGDGVMSIIPSVMDDSLAIAYLTDSKDDDMFNPRMLARAVVRLVRANDGRTFLLGCRPFFVDHVHTHVLFEGLKSHFDNFFSVLDVRKKRHEEHEVIRMSTNLIGYSPNSSDCSSCNGDGEDGFGDECEDCGGSGREINEMFYPYIDDDDVITDISRSEIVFRLPVSLTGKKGAFSLSLA